MSMSRAASRWVKITIAVVAGNAVYFALEPHLPYAAQHHAYRPDLGTLVDLWFCLMVWGVIEMIGFVRHRRRE
jgi:hypothetical protein